VADGELGEPNNGYAEIKIPNSFLIKDIDDPLKAIVDRTYPNIIEFYTNKEYLKLRTILVSTIENCR
jgi:ATP-dependent DNA helicase PIF1